MREKKRLLTVQMVGGLGNQIWLYLVGMSLGKRFQVDVGFEGSYLRKNSSHGENLLLDLDQNFKFCKDITFIEKVLYRLRSLTKSEGFMDFMSPSWQEEISGLEPTMGNYKSLRLRGYFQDARLVETEIETRLAHHFRTRPVNDELAEVMQLVKEPGTVVVHVRRGDYLLNPQFGVLDDEYYRRALDSYALNRPVTAVIVLSDEHDQKKLFEWGKNTQYVSPSFCSGSEALSLMANAKNLVVANSSLSFWGARFSRADVRYPEPPHQVRKSHPLENMRQEWSGIRSSFY